MQFCASGIPPLDVDKRPVFFFIVNALEIALRPLYVWLVVVFAMAPKLSRSFYTSRNQTKVVLYTDDGLFGV